MRSEVSKGCSAFLIGMIHREEFENSRDIIKYLLLLTWYQLHPQSTSIVAYIPSIGDVLSLSSALVIAFGLRRELLGFPLLTKLNLARTCAINKTLLAIKIYLVFIGTFGNYILVYLAMKLFN